MCPYYTVLLYCMITVCYSNIDQKEHFYFDPATTDKVVMGTIQLMMYITIVDLEQGQLQLINSK